MNDYIRDAARAMAQKGIDEGAKIAFDTAIKFCERLSQSYAMTGNQAATTAAQECANGIKGLAKEIDHRPPAAGE